MSKHDASPMKTAPATKSIAGAVFVPLVSQAKRAHCRFLTVTDVVVEHCCDKAGNDADYQVQKNVLHAFHLPSKS